MKISVITVTWNSAATVRHTVESFLAQSHRDSEMVVVDGASRDDTVAIVQGYGDPRIHVRSEPDGGIYDAMNKGLARYTGDAVGFLNSDDRYHDRDALARIAEGLENHDVVHGDLVFVRDHESRAEVRRWRGSAYSRGAFRDGWMPAHPTFYVRRSVAERTGAFDPEMKVAADYDYMLRAMETAPVRALHIDAVLVDMMAGGNSTRSWKAYVRGNIESLRARRRALGTGFVDYALVAKPLRKLSQLF